jgi:hypothetical protein
MSEYGNHWNRLSDWILHLQRKKTIDTPINPDKDNYKDGFNDAIDMIVRWVQAEEMSPTIPTGTTRGMWKKEEP